MSNKLVCPNFQCGQRFALKGRGLDGRRVYKCRACGSKWEAEPVTRKSKYHKQREGCQFPDSYGTGHTGER